MKRSPMPRTRIDSLRPGATSPDGEPRRYEDPRGYIRLRWKVGPGHYVETYERDAYGALVRTKPGTASRVDWDRAVELYTSGLSTPKVAAEVGCTPGTLSRGLRSRGVEMRRKRDYEDQFDPELVLSLYRQGMGVSDAARLAGTTYTRAAEVVTRAGLMRRPGRPKGARTGSYDIEFKSVRSAAIARSGGQCEAGVDGVCVGRVAHVHHRKIRRHGGTNDLANLLAVCHACHAWIHANPAKSYDRGLLIRGVGPLARGEAP